MSWTKPAFEIAREVAARFEGNMDERWGHARQTGLRDLDELLLGGLREGRVNLLAARPSLGKTTLALGIALHIAAKEKAKVLYLTFDVMPETLVRFLLSGMTGIDIHQLRSSANAETLAGIRGATKTLENVPLHFSLCCGMPLDEIDVPIGSVAEYDKEGEKNPIKLLVVDSLDYLGLDLAVFEPHQVPEKFEEREAVMQKLTKIARDQSLAILVLAQLGRGVEGRSGRPMIRDIPYCQYVEPYSDTILLLAQESYYSNGPMATEPARLIVAKNRFGPTGTVRLGFDRLHMQFLDVQTESPQIYEGKEKEQ